MQEFNSQRTIVESARNLFAQLLDAFEVLAERQYSAPWNAQCKHGEC